MVEIREEERKRGWREKKKQERQEGGRKAWRSRGRGGELRRKVEREEKRTGRK